MAKVLLRNLSELDHFIQDEANGNAWTRGELACSIHPESFPCIVITYWSKGAKGAFPNSFIIYPTNFQ